MTNFDDRKKGFENKFAHDAELKFKAESRRNKMIATWAAAKMNMTGPAVDDYVKAVRKADLASAGDDDVLQRIKTDFSAAGVKIADAEIRKEMDGFLAKAVDDIEAGRS